METVARVLLKGGTTMPMMIYHRPGEICPWQIWKKPDSEDERRHAIASAATLDTDRWEWVTLDGKQPELALFIAASTSKEGAQRYLEMTKK